MLSLIKSGPTFEALLQIAYQKLRSRIWGKTRHFSSIIHEKYFGGFEIIAFFLSADTLEWFFFYKILW